LDTEVSTIGEEIREEDELVSSDISTNQREILEVTSSSQKIINKSDYTSGQQSGGTGSLAGHQRSSQDFR